MGSRMRASALDDGSQLSCAVENEWVQESHARSPREHSAVSVWSPFFKVRLTWPSSNARNKVVFDGSSNIIALCM